MKNVLLLIVFVCLSGFAYGQSIISHMPDSLPRTGFLSTPDNMLRIMNRNRVNGLAAVYDTSRWREMIDAAWGQGISTEMKLKYFDHYWDTLNRTYASFIHLRPLNWDSAIASIRSEIASGVSRGRYASLLSKLNMMINDGHSGFYDAGVMWSPIYPGLPVLNSNGASNFGACLTPLADSTVLVYKVEKNHPFHLEPGDVILGYNNRPLGCLAQEVVDKEIPAFIGGLGSTYYATWHKLTALVAASWNLYDTIDIRKKDGSTVHYATKAMVSKNYHCDCFEIIPPEGITLPTIDDIRNKKNRHVSCVINGTGIGYAAMFDCSEMTGDSLLNRIKDLVENKNVKGLIIDIRTNYGGSLLAFYNAFSYLNDRSLTSWFGCAERADPGDRMSMNLHTQWISGYDCIKTNNESFDKPIALLTGPNAISAGDMMTVTFKQHPRLKTFGRSTSSAFGGIYGVELEGATQYYATMQGGNFYLTGDTITFLSHLEIPPDYPVWLSPEKAAIGRDDVIDAAVSWIESLTSAGDDLAADAGSFVWPNPAGNFIKINLPAAGASGIMIRDVMGMEVMSVSPDGSGMIDISALRPGMYVACVDGGGRISSCKFIKY